MTSFRVQFEKVGCGLLPEAKRREGEWAVLVEAKGDEKRLLPACTPNGGGRQ